MKNGVSAEFPSRAGLGPASRAANLPAPSFRPRRRATGARTLVLLAVLALVACSAVTRPAPIRQTFLIDAPVPQALPNAQASALRVRNINVAAPFRGKAFVYRMDELRFETDFYVEFLVPPAAMLTEQTARALDHAKPFARVVGPGATADAQWVLDGFASAIYADTRATGKPAAELSITYYLTSAGGGEQAPLWSREYRRRTAMRDSSPVAYAEALNAAFGEIVAELARDLASVQLPRP